jgi:hypothetical protein
MLESTKYGLKALLLLEYYIYDMYESIPGVTIPPPEFA